MSADNRNEIDGRSYRQYARELLVRIKSEQRSGLVLSVVFAVAGFLSLIFSLWLLANAANSAAVAALCYVSTVLALFLYGAFWGFKRIENNRSHRMGQLQDVILYSQMVEDQRLDHDKALALLVSTRRGLENGKLAEVERAETASTIGNFVKTFARFKDKA